MHKSRDSGFVGSKDDLLRNEGSHIIHTSSDDMQSKHTGSSSDGEQESRKITRLEKVSEVSENTEDDCEKSFDAKVTVASPKESSSVAANKSARKKSNESDASKEGSGEGGKLSRKDSFHQWSSDEETNIMMNRMRSFFKNMLVNASKGKPLEPTRKPTQIVYFEEQLTRLMKTVPGINDQQVKEIVEYLSSEDTWSDSYDSSDYTSSDLEGAYAVLDPTSGIPELSDGKSDLQQQISASCQEIIEKFDLDRSPEGSHLHINATVPWLPPGSDTEASGSLNKETAFVYQRLVNSLMRLNSTPKSTTAPASSTAQDADAEEEEEATTPHHSPPMIAKVLHHIGNRLVALMHEVSASSDTTSHSGSIDEDAQSAGRMKELQLAAHFQEPVTSSPRLTKIKGRLFVNKDCSSPDEKRSLSTSISSEETPTDTEQSPDSDESHTNRKKNADAGSIKFGFESLHTYEKRMSSLPPQPSSRADSDFRGFSSLESAESRGLIGGSRSLKARLAERARTLEAERRRLAEEKRMAEEQPDQNAQEEDPADEDRFYKKARKLPRFSLFRTGRSQENRTGGGVGGGGISEAALQSSSSGVSDIAEEKEDEFCGWRSSFESAIAADSRTKLSLEAKRRSAGGSASSSELFASSEQLLLDRGDSRRGVRSS